MPPLTRSRSGATKAPVTKTKPAVKSGATSKSASKSTSQAPPKKKARTNVISTDEPSRTLALYLASLPVELFLEVAKHLHPMDLINISHSNKLLRSTFMRRVATDVWRAALANIGLPPCPDPSMSEPRYAALMFLEQCTECYKPATRHVDPVFLVRLCYKCRKIMAMTPQNVGRYKRILLRSEFLVPPRGNAAKTYWYLSEHYEEVRGKARQLRADGNDEALKAWMNERAEFARTWREKVTPLVEWVEDQEKGYKAGLKIIRETRAEEIDARLLELGWELNDIQQADYYSDKWKPFVGKTKPLDEKEWNDMLPHLLYCLEKARKSRLKAEAVQRRSSRLKVIDDWLHSLPDAKVHVTLCQKDSNQSPKKDLTATIGSYPSGDLLLRSGQSYLEAVLDRDRSMEEFQLEFRDKRASLKEQLFTTWRPDIEAAIVKTLPAGLEPADIEGSDFYLQAHIGTKQTTALDNRLSMDLRKLLRADVRFKYQFNGRNVYYPEGFSDWMIPRGASTYDPKSSAIAKALLGVIQRPNASYFEMQALGQVFGCGRCPSETFYHTWEGIVRHYKEEKEDWKSACRRNERCSREGKEITLVFTHDITKINAEKPLVRLVPKQDQVPYTKPSDISKCKLCYSINYGYRTDPAHIVRHIQEVHLIEYPVLGEHYSEPMHWRL